MLQRITYGFRCSFGNRQRIGQQQRLYDLNSPTTQTTQLDTPGSLSSDQVTHNSARISWGAVSNVTNYTYQYRIGTGARTTQTTTNTRVTLTGLTASSNYNWRVRANGTGNFSNSGYSTDQNFSTSATPSSSWQLFADRGSAGAAGARGPQGDGLRWRGEWASTTTYAVRDLVHHNRSAWVATAAGRNRTPSGTSNFWDIYAESGERGATGPRGPQGPAGRDGTAADRGPSLFQISITEAQQTSLSSANNTTLPTALVTLADAATPGENQFGDMIRFYRGSYSDYWAWRDQTTDRWERMVNWIGAQQISAVDISAITGNFADINVTGRLAANKISGDVQNVTVLYESNAGQSVSSTLVVFNLTDDLRKYSIIETYQRAESGGYTSYGQFGLPASKIPTSTTALTDRPVAGGMRWYQSNSGRRVHLVRRQANTEIFLHLIIGFKQP